MEPPRDFTWRDGERIIVFRRWPSAAGRCGPARARVGGVRPAQHAASARRGAAGDRGGRVAHGAESLYTPFSNPVATMAALRGAELIATALDQDREGREGAALALGAILCGYAIDSAQFSLQHVICQTLVRVCGLPHAETNATILPHAIEAMSARPRSPCDRPPRRSDRSRARAGSCADRRSRRRAARPRRARARRGVSRRRRRGDARPLRVGVGARSARPCRTSRPGRECALRLRGAPWCVAAPRRTPSSAK